MRNAAITGVLCALAALSCTKQDLRDNHRIFNPDLAHAYQDYDAVLHVGRTPLSFAENGTATNCKSYLEMQARHRVEETVNNQLAKNEYLVCDALDILAKSAPTTVTSSNLGERVLSRLDLRSFPSSLYQASREDAHTLLSLYPSQTSSSGNVAQLDTEDWSLRMEVVAAAKVNANAAPDLIVWLADEAKSGNYRAYQTLVVFDVGSTGSLKAALYPAPP